ncbi:MAG: N-acyl homoserine lactonase family protein [Myxococcota bacterium]
MREFEITPLRLAQVELPASHPRAPGPCEIFGFLVRGGGHCVLVDTGVGVGNGLIDHLYKPSRVDLLAALSGVGVSLEQVSAIVNSHLHFDHCGNNRLFPGVPIFVQAAEFEAAREPHYTVRDWVEFPGSRYELVRGRRSIFSHIELFPTPGHSPGHQSVVVRSDSGAELIVAQAAYTGHEFESFRRGEGLAPQDAWSAGSYIDSLIGLHRVAAKRAFFSHDPMVWSGAA